MPGNAVIARELKVKADEVPVIFSICYLIKPYILLI